MQLLIDEFARVSREVDMLELAVHQLGATQKALSTLPDIVRRAAVIGRTLIPPMPLGAADVDFFDTSLLQSDVMAIVEEARADLGVFVSRYQTGAYRAATDLLTRIADMVAAQHQRVEGVAATPTEQLIRWGAVVDDWTRTDPARIDALGWALYGADTWPAVAMLAHAPDVARKLLPFGLGMQIEALIGHVPAPSPAEAIVSTYREWLAGRREWAAMLSEQGERTDQSITPPTGGPGDGQYPTAQGLCGLPEPLQVSGLTRALAHVGQGGHLAAQPALEITRAHVLAIETRDRYRLRGNNPGVRDRSSHSDSPETLSGVSGEQRRLLGNSPGEWRERDALSAAFDEAVAREYLWRDSLVVGLTPLFEESAAGSAIAAALDAEPLADQALLRAARDRAAGIGESIPTPPPPGWFAFITDLDAVVRECAIPELSYRDYIGIKALRLVRQELTRVLEHDRSGQLTGLSDAIDDAAKLVQRTPLAQQEVADALDAAPDVLYARVARPLLAAVAPALILTSNDPENAEHVYDQLMDALADTPDLVAPTVVNEAFHRERVGGSLLLHVGATDNLVQNVAPVLGLSVTDPPSTDPHGRGIGMGLVNHGIGLGIARSDWVRLNRARRSRIPEDLGLRTAGRIARELRTDYRRVAEPIVRAVATARDAEVVAAAANVYTPLLPDVPATRALYRAFAARGVPLRGDDLGGPDAPGLTTPNPTPSPTPPLPGPGPPGAAKPGPGPSSSPDTPRRDGVQNGEPPPASSPGTEGEGAEGPGEQSESGRAQQAGRRGSRAGRRAGLQQTAAVARVPEATAPKSSSPPPVSRPRRSRSATPPVRASRSARRAAAAVESPAPATPSSPQRPAVAKPAAGQHALPSNASKTSGSVSPLSADSPANIRTDHTGATAARPTSAPARSGRPAVEGRPVEPRSGRSSTSRSTGRAPLGRPATGPASGTGGAGAPGSSPG